MNSPIAGVPQQHSDLLKSPADFSKEHRAARWAGTFSSFLERVFPADARGIARSSHQYMWDMMRAEGYDDSHGRWRCQLFEDELYGIDETIERLVDYFKAAAGFIRNWLGRELAETSSLFVYEEKETRRSASRRATSTLSARLSSRRSSTTARRASPRSS